MWRPPAPHRWGFNLYILESTDRYEIEPSKPFKYNSTQKPVNQKYILWKSSHTLCFALYSISLHYKAFLGKNLSQENRLCFWSKGEIPVTNAMTNVSEKKKKKFSEHCVESRFIPWAIFLITADIYRPLQIWWRWMIMKLSPSEFWAPLNQVVGQFLRKWWRSIKRVIASVLGMLFIAQTQ